MPSRKSAAVQQPAAGEAAPAKPGRAFEAISLQIRKDIAAGVLKAGDKLAPERDLARQIGVGRNAVREALRDLESKGLLRLEQGRNGGAFVRAPNASRVTHAIGDMIDIGSLTLAELTEARVLFMEVLVRLACERATEADFAVLEQNVDETDEFTKAGQLQQRTERLVQFYTLLAESTRNAVFTLIATSLSSIVRRFLDQVPESRRAHLAASVPSRRRFLRFLRARDAGNAIREMDEHLRRLHRTMAQHLARQDHAADRPATRNVSSLAALRPAERHTDQKMSAAHGRR